MATTKTKAPDVLIANEGTVLTFCPLSSRAKRWIEENVHSDAYQCSGTCSSSNIASPGASPQA